MSYDPSVFWQQKPSLKLCATECGAKCCKDKQVPLTEDEVKMMGAMSPRANLRINTKTGAYFMLTGARCLFLGGPNECRIYGIRPRACRTFPSKPFEFCAVWSG